MDRVFNYDKGNCNFSYSIDNFDKITTSDYFEAVDKTLEDIFNEMSHLKIEKIALCLSGIDGEIIGKRLLKYHRHVEYFFLHVIGINDEHKKIIEEISQSHKVKLNVISTTFDFISKQFSHEVFDFCEITMATYLSIPYLIKNIPDDFYIIIGEGDLEKSNVNKYRNIFNNKIKEPNKDEIYVPLHLSEIIYNLSLKKYNKHGESNFYSRKFDTWFHVLKDHRLITNFRFYYDPKADFLYEICKRDFISPLKTLNFRVWQHRDLMKQIHSGLEGKASPDWSFTTGDVIVISKDLVF